MTTLLPATDGMGGAAGESSAGRPGPGWYQDVSGALRWWDGADWTERVQMDVPLPTAQRLPPNGPRVRTAASMTRATTDTDASGGTDADGSPPRWRRPMLVLGTVLASALVAGVVVFVVEEVETGRRYDELVRARAGQVAEKYVTAFLDGDLERACDLSAAEVQQRTYFRSMVQTSGYVVSSCREWALRYHSLVGEGPTRPGYRNLTFTGLKASGDHAVVDFSYDEVGADARPGRVHLVRRAGEWRVTILD